jgi:hypothetical protein
MPRLVILCVLVLLGLAPTVKPDEPKKYAGIPDSSLVRQLVELDQTVKQFDAELDQWKKQPLCSKLSLAELATREIGKAERKPNPDYEYPATCHDLQSRAGRAARILETLLKIELPFVTPRSTESELLRIKQEAATALEVYRTAVRATLDSLPVDAEQAKATEKKLSEIVKKIQFTSPLTNEQALKNELAIGELFVTWNPIGLTKDDLTKRFGVAPKEAGRSLSYVFVSPRVTLTLGILLDQSYRVKAVFFNSVY